VELNHSFTVPASVEDTWRHFEDIEGVAGCFPGAVVTEVQGDSFKGSAKVKLGPIALVYNGSGTFVEKDASAHRFVIEAMGKDKRGNGTAGATVTATLAAAGEDQTSVEVATDLNITGKPAQFGRGVMQDVSDKLLQQFVTCLQEQLGGGTATAGEEAGAAAGEARQAASVSSTTSGETADSASGPRKSPASTYAPPASVSPPAPAPAPQPARDEALDLGATVLPVLLRSYGPRAAVVLVALVIGWLLGRRSA